MFRITSATSENTLHTVDDFSHLAIDARRKFQDLRSRHQNLVMCQFIQSLQSILDISPPKQLLQILFCIQSVSCDIVPKGIGRAHLLIPA
jgi:hypothetical protein